MFTPSYYTKKINYCVSLQMSKKIVLLEKDCKYWKLRWEKTHNALLEMVTEKQMRDSEVATLNRKCSLLQELCRVFQQERATLQAQLKEKTNNSESDAPSEENKVDEQSEELSSNCQKLQANLAQVENSLSKITKSEESSPTKKSAKAEKEASEPTPDASAQVNEENETKVKELEVVNIEKKSVDEKQAEPVTVLPEESQPG